MIGDEKQVKDYFSVSFSSEIRLSYSERTITKLANSSLA